MGTQISYVEYALPEKVITNDDLVAIFPDMDKEKVEAKIGIKQRHVVADGQTALGLAQAAAQKVLKHINRDDIDYLLLCTQSPDYLLPTSACVLQDTLGLRKDIGALDFNLGCSGFVYGLSLAKGLIHAKVAKNVLLVTSETYSKHLYHKDRSNRIIFGDGAAATVVTASATEKLMEFELGTDGASREIIMVRNGGMKHPLEAAPEELADASGNITTNNHFSMSGRDVFNFTIANIPKAVKNCLLKNQMELEDLDMVIFHQANKFMLEYLRKKIGIPEEKFFVDMELTGNTVSATIPIALRNAREKGMVKTGDKVLLAGFGVGLSWAVNIIEL